MICHRRLVLILLSLPLSYGKIVDGRCRPFEYQHPHRAGICMKCRICPDYIVSDENLLKLYQVKQCKDNVLADGRKVQCTGGHNGQKFVEPSCRPWSLDVGSVNCSRDNKLYSQCSLQCPLGYTPSDNSRIQCLPSLHNHVRWSKDEPYCVAVDQAHGNSKKTLSMIAMLLLIAVCALSPCVLINMYMYFVGKNTQIQQQAVFDDVQAGPHLVDIELLNAKRSQRCYILKKWSVNRGTTITVQAKPVDATVSVRDFILHHAKSQDQPYYGPPGAQDEIVLHQVKDCHRGHYDWTVTLSNNQSETGNFTLDIKSRSFIETAYRMSRQLSNMSNASEMSYHSLHEDEDVPLFGFSDLLRNMEDTKRLCILFDQEPGPNKITWRDLGKTFLHFDGQKVLNNEYRLRREKDSQGPTYTVLKIMHQEGKSVQDLVDVLKVKVGPNCEAVQILGKYL